METTERTERKNKTEWRKSTNKDLKTNFGRMTNAAKEKEHKRGLQEMTEGKINREECMRVIRRFGELSKDKEKETEK